LHAIQQLIEREALHSARTVELRSRFLRTNEKRISSWEFRVTKYIRIHPIWPANKNLLKLGGSAALLLCLKLAFRRFLSEILLKECMHEICEKIGGLKYHWNGSGKKME
jgi:hypothetical protein